ncbi:MAG: hypothetical protein ACRERU_09635, partial [Methylococcales bacterium]
ELKAVGWQSSWLLVMDQIAGSDFEQPKAGSAGVNRRDGVNNFLPGGHSRTCANSGLVRAWRRRPIRAVTASASKASATPGIDGFDV